MKKIFILSFLVFLFSCTPSSSEEIRKPAARGTFYPQNKRDLTGKINKFLDNVEKVDIKGEIIAIIVPHAGYDYSGQVAAHSFKQLEGCKINSIAIICNSHTAHFPGIAIDDSDSWETPLGLVKLDRNLADKLVSSDEEIHYNSEVHRYDHTIETQLPFLQTVLEGDFKIVPLLFGNRHDDSYKKLALSLASKLGKNDIIVISTDMSHYPSYEDANIIDRGTLEVIKTQDVSMLEEYIRGIESQNIPSEQTLVCGIDGVKTIIEVSNILGARIKVLKYANSGDVAIGDKSRVVGYSSAVIYIPEALEGKEEELMNEEYLNKDEKKKLIEIARFSIIEAVTGKKGPEIQAREEHLKENCGAFVTIKKHSQLRGCIGYIQAVKPLYETVKDVARSAAINDFRFSPTREGELDDIELEISVLTPLKRIKDVNEIQVGKHGLYMKRGFNSGILLPQVATENNWDRDTFLGHTCIKAGLPRDAWKDKSTEIFIFSAEVFGEKDIE